MVPSEEGPALESSRREGYRSQKTSISQKIPSKQIIILPPDFLTNPFVINSGQWVQITALNRLPQHTAVCVTGI